MIAVGNGESRARVPIPRAVIGCNAIHRNYIVDYLVCTDRAPLSEALESPNTKNTKIYTKAEWINFFKDSRLHLVPDIPYLANIRADDPRHWSSGTYAVLLAAMLSTTISMIGFDLYGKQGLINNIYKDSLHYSSSLTLETDPNYWIYQISRVFNVFPDKYFTVYNDVTWRMPDSWQLHNVEYKCVDNIQGIV